MKYDVCGGNLHIISTKTRTILFFLETLFICGASAIERTDVIYCCMHNDTFLTIRPGYFSIA
jgi:hypothetical protein